MRTGIDGKQNSYSFNAFYWMCLLEVARHPQIKYADHCLNGSIQGAVAVLPYSGAEKGEIISDEND